MCLSYSLISEKELKKLQHERLKLEKEVANSLMVFNLWKIIHPFQDKKYFRA